MNDLLLITEKNFGTGQGIFFDMASDPSAIANLKKREIPIIENCLMARLYIRLNSSTDKEIFREKAKSILNFFAPRYQQFAFFAASYGSALIDWFYPVIDVTITGKKNDPKAKELFSAVMKLPTNRLHVKWADPVKNEPPKVVMCVGKQCLTPAENADQISIRFEIAQKIVQSRS